MPGFDDSRIRSLIYSVEDRNWEELTLKLNKLSLSERDLEDVLNRVVWLQAQTDFNHIVEMTCQLVRELIQLRLEE